VAGILVLHPGALGDIVLALPAIRLVRDQFRDIPLTLAGSSDFVPAVSLGYAERVFTLSTMPLHRLYSPGPLPPEDEAFWKSYDRVVAWTGFGDPVFLEQLSRVIPETLVAGWRPAGGERRHVSRIFAESLQPWLGEVTDMPLPRIAVSDDNQAAADKWLSALQWSDSTPIVALHPGAGNREKRWPLPNYAELARALTRERKCGVILVEGPAERGIAAEVADGAARGRVAIAKSLPVKVLAGVLARCAWFVGNDSGISHLAAALGIASIALFGPTSPEVWAPLGPHVQVMRDVRGCRACEGSAPGSHNCMDNIRPESVLDRFELK
jgi:heptosyltransferase III